MYQTLDDFLVKTSGIVGNTESITLLHGWGMNSQVWTPILQALEERFQVICVDLPGHGINQSYEAQSLDEIVETIMPLLPQNTHLVGWSLGGLVAQAIAQSAQNTIQSLRLVACTPRFSQYISQTPQASQEDDKQWLNAMSLDTLDQFSQNLQMDFEGTLKRFIALQFMGVKGAKKIQSEMIESLFDISNYDQDKSAASPNSGDIIELSVSKNETASSLKRGGGVFLPSKNALDVGLSILKTADMRFKRINTPTQWIFGGRDRLIPKAVINDLKSLRPDDQITLLDEAGHAPFMTHPDEFLNTLLPFTTTRHTFS